ncbi:hypothetical protein LPB41_30695 [Thalassospira sp. MA62]|nr:hypothetical protein [Thalassospira sp. MA62]
MHNFTLEKASPFPSVILGSNDAGITISPQDQGFVLHVMGKVDLDDQTVSNLLTSAVPDCHGGLRKMSPGQWLWVGANDIDSARIDDLIAKVLGTLAISDQTHGRVRLRISGAAVCDVLAKGVMVDLSLNAFPVGHTAMTQIGHIGAMIARLAEDQFEIIVLRSFAESLWHELDVMSAEYR